MTSLRDNLRRADDRVVPYAAARLRAAVDGRPRPGAVRPPPRGPGGVLRRLDARYARRGVPQLAALALTGVLVAGSAALLGGLPDDGRGVGAGQSPASSEQVVLGPAPGARVEEYLAQARSRAVELSRQRPEASHVALVSFEGYARPEQADAALGDLEVLRVYLRAPGDSPSEVLAPEVADLVPDLEALYAATARRRAQDAEELRALAATLGPDRAAQRSAYQAQAEQAEREARAYRTGCGCLFGVVVRAPAAELAPLPAMEGFRGVDLAPRGVPLEDVEVRVLLPEHDEVVTPLPSLPRAPAPAPAPGPTGG